MEAAPSGEAEGSVNKVFPPPAEQHPSRISPPEEGGSNAKLPLSSQGHPLSIRSVTVPQKQR